MSRRRIPGRETTAAISNERRTWYGWGQLTRVEKSWFGLFLHDVTRLFAEISVISLPVLLAAMAAPATGWFDAKATGLVAWATLVVTATLIRIGTVPPIGSETPGWVTLAPELIVLRVGYFNGGLAAAIFGGLAVHDSIGTLVTSDTAGIAFGLGWALAISVGMALVFPRVAEEWLSIVR